MVPFNRSRDFLVEFHSNYVLIVYHVQDTGAELQLLPSLRLQHELAPFNTSRMLIFHSKYVLIVIKFRSFVRYCGQRPSLLWTSALRPGSEWSTALAHREDGNL